MSRRRKKPSDGALKAQRCRLINEVADLERWAAHLREWVPVMERACLGVLHAVDRSEDLLRCAKRDRVDTVVAAEMLEREPHPRAGEWAMKDAYVTMQAALNSFTSEVVRHREEIDND